MREAIAAQMDRELEELLKQSAENPADKKVKQAIYYVMRRRGDTLKLKANLKATSAGKRPKARSMKRAKKILKGSRSVKIAALKQA